MSGQGQRDPWLPSETEVLAEQAVLGGMLLSRNAVADVATVLEPEDLYQPRHQAIMRAILDLDSATGPYDHLTVLDTLEKRGELGKVGGAGYLLSLIESVPTTANAAYYADQVRASATRRAAAELARRIHQHAGSASDTQELIAAVQEAHGRFQTASATRTATLAGAGTLTVDLDEIARSWGQRPASSFTTGITDLDRILNVDNGGMVVVSGRTGSGKSIFAGQIARHYAIYRQEPVLFFGMEMSKTELMRRDLSALSQVRPDTAFGGGISYYDRQQITMAVKRYKAEATTLIYDDTPGVSAAYIRSTIRDAQREHGAIGLVVVDQLPLMQLPKRDREDQALGEVARQLKLFAQEFNTLMLPVTQLNRGPDQRATGEPHLSDVRGSDAIAHNCDALLLLHDVGRYDDARGGQFDIFLAKQRDGITGARVTVADRRHCAQFSDMSSIPS